MTIEKRELKISTTGSAGSATGSSVEAVPACRLVKVHLDYHASAPATTDVTIIFPGNPASETILTVTNNATDGYYYPKTQDHDSSAAAVTGSYSDPVVHGGHIQIDIAQADALTDCVVATFWIEY